MALPYNARVQLQRIPIRVRAQRAQSIAPLAAATHVRELQSDASLLDLGRHLGDRMVDR